MDGFLDYRDYPRKRERMKDEKLEQLAQQILDRAEELGVDSISVSWWFGNEQQERSYFNASDIEKAKEKAILDAAFAAASATYEVIEKVK